MMLSQSRYHPPGPSGPAGGNSGDQHGGRSTSSTSTSTTPPAGEDHPHGLQRRRYDDPPPHNNQQQHQDRGANSEHQEDSCFIATRNNNDRSAASCTSSSNAEQEEEENRREMTLGKRFLSVVEKKAQQQEEPNTKRRNVGNFLQILKDEEAKSRDFDHVKEIEECDRVYDEEEEYHDEEEEEHQDHEKSSSSGTRGQRGEQQEGSKQESLSPFNPHLQKEFSYSSNTTTLVDCKMDKLTDYFSENPVGSSTSKEPMHSSLENSMDSYTYPTEDPSLKHSWFPHYHNQKIRYNESAKEVLDDEPGGGEFYHCWWQEQGAFNKHHASSISLAQTGRAGGGVEQTMSSAFYQQQKERNHIEHQESLDEKQQGQGIFDPRLREIYHSILSTATTQAESEIKETEDYTESCYSDELDPNSYESIAETQANEENSQCFNTNENCDDEVDDPGVVAKKKSPPEVLVEEQKGKYIITTTSLKSPSMRSREKILANVSDPLFKRRLEQVLNYKDTHANNPTIPYRYAEDKKLGIWFHNQKRRYQHWKRGQDGGMSKERRELFHDLGINLNNQAHGDEKWNIMFEKLKCHKAKYGHLHVSVEIDPTLSSWVRYQKSKKKRSLLSERQQSLLKDIGLDFSGGTHNHLDVTRIEELKKYKRTYGHTIVPTECIEYPDLGKWLYRQKISFRKNVEQGTNAAALKASRKKKFQILRGLGVDFGEENINKRLDEECQRNGNLYVEEGEKGKLKCAEDKKVHSFSSVNDENEDPQKNKAKEEQDGFVVAFPSIKNQSSHMLPLTDPSSTKQAPKRRLKKQTRVCSDSFKAKLEQLINFENRYKHTNVPDPYPEDPEFGYWFAQQRLKYARWIYGESNGMPENERKMFDVLGIDLMTFSKWEKVKTVGSEQWETSLKKLEGYKGKTGEEITHAPPVSASLFSQRLEYNQQRRIRRWAKFGEEKNYSELKQITQKSAAGIMHQMQDQSTNKRNIC